jgi:hypothetical protein
MGTRALTVHGACGKTWHQRGNLTGHCGGCHETFEGLRVFDSHQRIDGGVVTCLDPATVMDRGVPLRLIDGTWRGRSMPKELHAEPEED